MRETILGGTTEEGFWEEVTTQEAIDRIFENAKRIIPELTREHIIRTYAGLRPYRISGARVELEEKKKKAHVVSVGFGGSGWTFCFGAAEKAVSLVRSRDYDKAVA